jgi:hypothetical protein
LRSWPSFVPSEGSFVARSAYLRGAALPCGSLSPNAEIRTMLIRCGLLLMCSLPALAAGTAGRWEGVVRIPGAPMPIVIDLGAAAGSVTLPGRGVSGAPLRELAAGASGIVANLSAAIPSPGGNAPPSSIELTLQPDGRLEGTFRQGGHSAPVTLLRSGDAQVTKAPASTPISAALAGVWKGRYELFGYPREVTLTLKDGPPAAGNAALVIVGKRTSNVPIDRVVQGTSFITFESDEYGMTIEGRVSAGTIEGTLQQGPFEVPLVLRREGAGS